MLHRNISSILPSPSYVVYAARRNDNDDLDDPDDLLPQVFGILEEWLSVASGLLGDIEAVYFQTPTSLSQS